MPDQYSKEHLKEQARQKAHDYELRFHGCSQAVLLTFQELLGLRDELTFRAASSLCAGLGAGKTCGALTGGVMVLGMKFGRPRMEDGVAGLIAGFAPAQRLVSEFEREFGTTVCGEISEVDWTDPDAVLRALADDDFARKCADVVGRTAEIVAGIVADEAPTQE